MAKDRPTIGLSLARRRAQRMVLHAFVGLLFGYFVLHPVSMAIFRWLDASGHGHGAPLTPQTIPFEAIAESFQLHMLPMGLLFGVFCAVIGTMDGFYRATVLTQRDDLVRQLSLNERYRQNLEVLVGQLETRNRRLAELELAKRRTTRFMVHDFKTHLGCILGFSNHLLTKTELISHPEVRDGLERIRRQGMRMAGAVTDLLELARLQESGRLKKQATPVAGLLEEVARDLALPAESGRVQIGPKHVGCPPLFVDSKLIGRVLSNLVSNAFKHNPQGTKVVIDADVTSEEPRNVTFSCQDEGKGIPPETIPTIFEEFTIDSRSPSSTGLGLAFCRAAVEAHKGRIWCQSSLGKGTTFLFTIPITLENHEALPPQETTRAKTPLAHPDDVTEEERRLGIVSYARTTQ